jgi:hypothetical protein
MSSEDVYKVREAWHFGYHAYAAGQFSNPYGADSFDAQCPDRGLQAGMADDGKVGWD